MYRIHSQRVTGDTVTLLCLLAELVFYVALDVATTWVFLYKPFKWPNSSDWQRFMW